MSQDLSYRIDFTAPFGAGYVHVQPTARPSGATAWEWQVYIGDTPQFPEPHSPRYQGQFPNVRLAIQSASLWMYDYFLSD